MGAVCYHEWATVQIRLSYLLFERIRPSRALEAPPKPDRLPRPRFVARHQRPMADQGRAPATARLTVNPAATS